MNNNEQSPSKTSQTSFSTVKQPNDDRVLLLKQQAEAKRLRKNKIRLSNSKQ